MLCSRRTPSAGPSASGPLNPSMGGRTLTVPVPTISASYGSSSVRPSASRTASRLPATSMAVARVSVRTRIPVASRSARVWWAGSLPWATSPET
ncbi:MULTISPECIES: hypothetical protein [unclassified Streptomyces]|uniref:hypothetical protein n=1 Tax=unclassified Streptomyces TaxID=2593676 RepID=UPI0019CFCA05|nr:MULTISPECIES: hypothetical protein [unclassified Streptomyces]